MDKIIPRDHQRGEVGAWWLRPTKLGLLGSNLRRSFKADDPRVDLRPKDLTNPRWFRWPKVLGRHKVNLKD